MKTFVAAKVLQILSSHAKTMNLEVKITRTSLHLSQAIDNIPNGMMYLCGTPIARVTVGGEEMTRTRLLQIAKHLSLNKSTSYI